MFGHYTNLIRALSVALPLATSIGVAYAQQGGHEGHTPPPPGKEGQKQEPAGGMPGMDHGGMNHQGMDHSGHTMPAATDLNIPMNRAGSGTSWLPDSSPMFGRMYMRGSSMLMLHGVITPRFMSVDTPRGQKNFSAPNWFMAMYNRPLSEKDQLGFLFMSSLDFITNGNDGYPLLFQTGETYRENRLVDRQHPHDLVSELAFTYSRYLPGRTFGATNSATLYIGYPGEPALGPPTFMHRLIALDLPDSPLGHHWTDSTHVTFGVATLGLNFGKKIKVEGSLFNGSEPDERRYDFDTLRLNSQSGRISWNPNSQNAFQISYGFIKEPEALEPGISQHRTTASWIYNKPLGEDANLTTSVVWGRNLKPGHGGTNAYLAEAHYQNGPNNAFFRAEKVEKEGEELGLDESLANRNFNVGAYTLGYVYDISHGKGLDLGVGGAVTMNTKPSALDPVYGRGNPVSFQVMVRLRPSRMRSMGGMSMSGMNMPGGMPGMDMNKKP